MPARAALEHVGLNVPEPALMAKWYSRHLGMKVIRASSQNQMHFLADSTGRVVLEIYRNPAARVPDYFNQSPLVLHVAFEVDDVCAARDRLVAAGATLFEDRIVTDAGDEMAMLRDPWGLPIQVVKRKQRLLS